MLVWGTFFLDDPRADINPSSEVPNMGRGAMMLVWQRLSWQNNVDYIYTTAEKEFVAEVEQVLPEGAVIINNPNDGSCFLLRCRRHAHVLPLPSHLW